MPQPVNIPQRGEQRLGPGIADFSNLDRDGRIMSAETACGIFKLGDRPFGIRQPFRPVRRSIRSSPGASSPPGVRTQSSPTMRAAYDALDERTKAEIEDLVCDIR